MVPGLLDPFCLLDKNINVLDHKDPCLGVSKLEAPFGGFHHEISSESFFCSKSPKPVMLDGFAPRGTDRD